MASQPTDYEKKLIEMQFQMKENQSYMQDCFADLDSWTKDIKEKEKKILENPDSFKNSNKGLPPIRTLETKKKKKKKINKQTSSEDSKENKSTTSKSKKLNSYDYRAWDKLDVDALCKEVDEKNSSDCSEYTTDEEWENEQKKVKAEWEKERGNQFFKDNLLNEAINCYTKAIELDPSNCIYPANRAMCLIKQEKYAAAEVDCTLSITLDLKYTKAYHRRALCRTNLKKYDEAKKDYEFVLTLEPDSKLAKQELNKLEQLMDSRKLVFPIDKKEELRSKKPLKRIVIEEINDESADRLQMTKIQEILNEKSKLTDKEEKLFELSSKLEKNEIKTPKDKFEEKISKKIEIIEEIKTENKTITNNFVKKELPGLPSNGYQFKKDWQLLSSNFENLIAYFMKIPANQYKKLFLNGLESDYLSKILLMFKNYHSSNSEMDLFDYMFCLSQVNRFKTQLMFLSSSDTKIIDELIDILKNEAKKDVKEIKNLAELFKY